jgi:hypothetical protein
MESFNRGRLPLKCEKCLNVEKTQETDTYGNIHVTLWCKKRYWIVLNIIVYNADFLWRIRENQLFRKTAEDLKLLPENKRVEDLKLVEVLFEQKIDKCKYFVYKGEPLDRWFGETKGLNTCNI